MKQYTEASEQEQTSEEDSFSWEELIASAKILADMQLIERD